MVCVTSGSTQSYSGTQAAGVTWARYASDSARSVHLPCFYSEQCVCMFVCVSQWEPDAVYPLTVTMPVFQSLYGQGKNTGNEVPTLDFPTLERSQPHQTVKAHRASPTCSNGLLDSKCIVDQPVIRSTVQKSKILKFTLTLLKGIQNKIRIKVLCQIQLGLNIPILFLILV